MKELLQHYAAYNLWANQKLLHTIALLPEDQQSKYILSSFEGLIPTLKHMWDAEYMWWQRLKLSDNVARAAAGQVHNFVLISDGLLYQGKVWQQWIEGATLLQLEHVFAYRNIKGDELKQPVYRMLLHLFNHATYHRGQLVTMLRQLGVTNIPATDFALWSTSLKK